MDGKRLFDLVAGTAALVVAAPVMAVVAALVRWRLGPPVLFVQRRPGRHGEPFDLYKFRTLREAYDERGRPLPDAQRMTRLGAVLRATSLDELPELWNVVRGDMSLVGPRPLLMDYLPRYTPEQARRHDVRPGLTGLAQVSGRNAITWEQRFALDLRYVDEHDLRMDLDILMRTVSTVMSREGVSRSDEESMPEYLGSGALDLADGHQHGMGS